MRLLAAILIILCASSVNAQCIDGRCPVNRPVVNAVKRTVQPVRRVVVQPLRRAVQWRPFQNIRARIQARRAR